MGKRSVEMKIETMTPEWAGKILANNNHVNRKLRERMVRTLAQDMKQGLFNGLNGETIKIGEDGQLKDGQHRLQAVVESDTAVPMAIMYGVPNDSQATIDMGVKRGYHDVLHMRGEGNTTVLAAVIKLVTLRLEGMGLNDGKYLSFMQLDRTFDKFPELRSIAREAERIGHNGFRLVPKSMIGYCAWLFGQINEEDASYFIARLTDGQNLAEGNPIYTLRKRLLLIRETGGKPNARTILGSVLVAWNAWRDGRELHVLRFKAGGSKPDKLPEPR